MNRFLQYFNLCGVVALAVLCGIQWQANRKLNLSLIRLEKDRQQQTLKMGEQEQTLKGSRADLDDFRQRLVEATTSLKETAAKLAETERRVYDLTAERDQLKTSVTNWAAAVTARDQRLKEAGEQLQKLAADRNATVTKYNELAARYNDVVKDLNELRSKYAELVAARAKANQAADGK